MRITYFICGERVLLDQITNRATVVSILDGMASPQFPFFIPNFAFIISLEKEENEADALNGTVSFKLGDQLIIDGPIDADFQGNNRTRIMTNIGGFIVPGPGTIVGEVQIPGVDPAKWLLQIEQLGPQGMQQIQPG